MLAIFLIYALLPVIIVIRVPRTTDKRIKKCRLRYAIPAIILTTLNVAYFIYTQFIDEFHVFDESEYAFLLPGLSLALTLIVFNAGLREEKSIHKQLTGEEIEQIRFRKTSTSRTQLSLDLEEEEPEKL